MSERKFPFICKSKKGDINKEVIEHNEDTKRKMKEKFYDCKSIRNKKIPNENAEDNTQTMNFWQAHHRLSCCQS